MLPSGQGIVPTMVTSPGPVLAPVDENKSYQNNLITFLVMMYNVIELDTSFFIFLSCIFSEYKLI